MKLSKFEKALFAVTAAIALIAVASNDAQAFIDLLWWIRR